MTDSEESFPEKEEKQNGLEMVLECFPEMSWYHFGVGCEINSQIWKNGKIDVLLIAVKIRKNIFFESFIIRIYILWFLQLNIHLFMFIEPNW